MPLPFVYVQKSRENDPQNWFYACEANTLDELEQFTLYSSIDHESKLSFNGQRQNSPEKDLHPQMTGGVLRVVAYRLTPVMALAENFTKNTSKTKHKHKSIRKPSKKKKLRLLKAQNSSI